MARRQGPRRRMCRAAYGRRQLWEIMKNYAQARRAPTNSLRPLPGAFDRPRLAGTCRHARPPMVRCLTSSPLYEPTLNRLPYLGVAEAGGWIALDQRERQGCRKLLARVVDHQQIRRPCLICHPGLNRQPPVVACGGGVHDARAEHIAKQHAQFLEVVLVTPGRVNQEHHFWMGDEQSLQVRQPAEVRDGHALCALARGVKHSVEIQRNDAQAIQRARPQAQVRRPDVQRDGTRIAAGVEDPDKTNARGITKSGSAVPSAGMIMMLAGARSRRIIGMYVAHPVHPAGVGRRRATEYADLAGALFGCDDDRISTLPD